MGLHKGKNAENYPSWSLDTIGQLENSQNDVYVILVIRAWSPGKQDKEMPDKYLCLL